MTCSHVGDDGKACKRRVNGERCWQHKKHEATDALLQKMAETDAAATASAQETDRFMRQFKAAGVTE